jgi:hypothetical protein
VPPTTSALTWLFAFGFPRLRVPWCRSSPARRIARQAVDGGELPGHVEPAFAGVVRERFNTLFAFGFQRRPPRPS